MIPHAGAQLAPVSAWAENVGATVGIRHVDHGIRAHVFVDSAHCG